MELTELKNRIIAAFSGTCEQLQEVLALVEKDNSVFPFNEYEYLICSFVEKDGLTYQDYLDIRNEYIQENPYLWLFEESSPRHFGENFAQTYVQGKCRKLEKASKKFDPDFDNQYDLWLDGIKIEVKASRATDRDSEDSLYMKALSRNTQKRFLMNFQQLKPQCCDVFIWVAVFRDEIVLWIMNSDEIRNHPLYSGGQHRGNKGNEGQLHINQDNVHQLNEYELRDDNLEAAIRDAVNRMKFS